MAIQQFYPPQKLLYPPRHKFLATPLVAISTFEQIGSALFDASLLKIVLFEMYNYLTTFRPVLLCAPLQLCALCARLVRLWVNPTLGTCNKPEISILEGRVFRPHS